MTDSSEGEDMQFGSNESRMGKKKEAKVKVFLRSLGDMEFVQEIQRYLERHNPPPQSVKKFYLYHDLIIIRAFLKNQLSEHPNKRQQKDIFTQLKSRLNLNTQERLKKKLSNLTKQDLRNHMVNQENIIFKGKSYQKLEVEKAKNNHEQKKREEEFQSIFQFPKKDVDISQNQHPQHRQNEHSQVLRIDLSKNSQNVKNTNIEIFEEQSNKEKQKEKHQQDQEDLEVQNIMNCGELQFEDDVVVIWHKQKIVYSNDQIQSQKRDIKEHFKHIVQNQQQFNKLVLQFNNQWHELNIENQVRKKSRKSGKSTKQPKQAQIIEVNSSLSESCCIQEQPPTNSKSNKKEKNSKTKLKPKPQIIELQESEVEKAESPSIFEQSEQPKQLNEQNKQNSQKPIEVEKLEIEKQQLVFGQRQISQFSNNMNSQEQISEQQLRKFVNIQSYRLFRSDPSKYANLQWVQIEDSLLINAQNQTEAEQYKTIQMVTKFKEYQNTKQRISFLGLKNLQELIEKDDMVQ